MRFLLSTSFSWLVKHFVDPGVYIVLHNTDLHLVKSDDDPHFDVQFTIGLLHNFGFMFLSHTEQKPRPKN